MKKLVMLLLSALLAVSPAMAEETIEEQFTEIETEYQEEVTTEAAEIVTEYVEEETEAVTEEIITTEPVTEEIVTEPEPVTEEAVIEEPTTVVPEPTTEEYLIDAWSGTEQITDLKGTSSPEGSVLTWSPIPDAEGYLIGAIQNGNAYKQIGYVVGGNTTTYTDKDASMEKYSYYWVFPYKRVNGKIARGAVSSRYVYGIKLMAAPQNFKAEGVPGAINLSWNPVPDASRYIIKVRRGNGTVEQLADTYKTTYTDEAAPNDVVSYYWVLGFKYGYPNDYYGASSTYAFAKPIPSGSGFTEIGKFCRSYEYSSTTHYYIILRNDNGGNARVKANVVAYDANNNIIGASDDTWFSSKPGYTILLDGIFSNVRADQISRIEYTLTTSPSSYVSAQADVNINSTILNGKAIVTVTNIGGREISSSHGTVLFLNGGRVIDDGYFSATNSSSKFTAGASVTQEVNCYDPFDSILVFYEGYYFN